MTPEQQAEKARSINEQLTKQYVTMKNELKFKDAEIDGLRAELKAAKNAIDQIQKDEWRKDKVTKIDGELARCQEENATLRQLLFESLNLSTEIIDKATSARDRALATSQKIAETLGG